MNRFAAMGVFDKRQQGFFKNFIIIRTTHKGLIAKLIKGEPAFGASGFFFCKVVDFFGLWGCRKQSAEQLIDWYLAFCDCYALLSGAVLTEMHLGADAAADFRQMNGSLIVITDLTLHIKLPLFDSARRDNFFHPQLFNFSMPVFIYYKTNPSFMSMPTWRNNCLSALLTQQEYYTV
jgi:hypothetical protein